MLRAFAAAVKVDDKGKTTTMTKEQVVRGKRLFNAACASCHVGGGTRTNQNVGLAIEELSGATPNRATVEGIVDYINNPTTYDGLKDWGVGRVGLGDNRFIMFAFCKASLAQSRDNENLVPRSVARECLQDISEVHPSIKGGDIWPKMRSMKQQDCVHS